MMRNYLCWDPGSVRQVINPFAEHIGEGIFRAVHTDWDLMVSPPVGTSFQDLGVSSYEEMTPVEFLHDFLREDRPHALAAILGGTGSGKSHLVHWMRLNVKDTPQRRVLVVKKSGTSLRAIVKMIIDDLPPEEQQSFLDTLNSAGEGTSSRDGQKQQLLNDIAQTIREELLPSDANEIEAELSQQVPHLFQDPHMRQAHFLGENNVISEIVDHIFAPSNASNRPNKRRSFSERDLPLGGSDFSNASKQARDAIQVIELDRAAYLPLAIQIINRNLDKAVARTLSFSGDRVEELMARLRAHLKSAGRELVLLVEEFARLQGIDRALLQVMTSHGDAQQCKIRSAIAVTTGFFASVAETAYMRTTHIVDMDHSAARVHGQGVTPESLGEFAAHYLNAARLGPVAIETWSATAMPSDAPPSKCDECRFQGPCHKTFGAVDGYGLYPFTTTALWNSATRASETMPTSLNPRILQNNVLVEVLDNLAPTIASGEFPPYRLLEKLSPKDLNIHLSLTAQMQLENRNAQMAKRWITFLEVYDGTGEIKNLPAPLRDAFGIPEIPDAQEIAPAPQPGPEQPFQPGTLPTNREDAAISDWISGRGLEQNIASLLRQLVFFAIVDAIDWDLLGLSRTQFAGRTGRPFQANSISFDRQTTQVPHYLQVKLKIPGDLVTGPMAGSALQGLLHASKRQFRWDFEGGDKKLSAFLDCLETWVVNVEDQLRKSCSPSPKWNQAVAAVELLCIGAAIGGKVKPDATVADMIDAAFSHWPSECASTAPEMRVLYDRLFKSRDKIATVARAQISSMKGGQVGAMLHPPRYMSAIHGLRKSKWKLGLEPPDDDRSDVAKPYRETKAGLASAAKAEWDARSLWLSDMMASFGNDLSRAKIVSILADARQAALDAGINSQHTSAPLHEFLNRFNAVQFDDSIAAAQVLAKYDDPVAALAHFGRGRRNAVEAGLELKQRATQFLDTVERNVAAFTKDHENETRSIKASLIKIDESLQTIDDKLTEISGDSGSANVA